MIIIKNLLRVEYTFIAKCDNAVLEDRSYIKYLDWSSEFAYSIYKRSLTPMSDDVFSGLLPS